MMFRVNEEILGGKIKKMISDSDQGCEENRTVRDGDVDKEGLPEDVTCELRAES